jgi:hypothetical protein
MQRVSVQNESPLIVECRSCAHREYAEVLISPNGFFDNKKVEYRRVVVCRESEKAKVWEVRALRKLKPEFGGLPMNEAVRRIGSSRYIDLGVHSLDDAQNILERTEAQGLKARLEHPDENTIADQERYRFFEQFGAPVSVGEPGEDTIVIPFGWILIGIALILAVLVWMLL